VVGLDLFFALSDEALPPVCASITIADLGDFFVTAQLLNRVFVGPVRKGEVLWAGSLREVGLLVEEVTQLSASGFSFS